MLAAVSSAENLQPTLNVSARLKQVYGNRLVVLLSTTKHSITPGELSHEASALLKQESEHLHVHFRQIRGIDLLSIAHAVQAEGGGILAMGESVCPPKP